MARGGTQLAVAQTASHRVSAMPCMPCLDFIFDEADERRLVEYLFAEGFSMIPEIAYPTRRLKLCRNLRTYYQVRKQRGRFLLVRGDFMVSPLEGKNLGDEGAPTTYRISHSRGGPAMDLCLGPEYTRNGRLPGSHAFGWIGYDYCFWNTSRQAHAKAPAAQQTAYQEIVSFIRRNSVPSIPKGYLIGDHLAARVREGSVKLHLGTQARPFVLLPAPARRRPGAQVSASSL